MDKRFGVWRKTFLGEAVSFMYWQCYCWTRGARRRIANHLIKRNPKLVWKGLCLCFCMLLFTMKGYLAPNITLQMMLVAADNKYGFMRIGIPLASLNIADKTWISSRIRSSNVNLPTPKSLSACRVKRRSVRHGWPLLYVRPAESGWNEISCWNHTQLDKVAFKLSYTHCT